MRLALRALLAQEKTASDHVISFFNRGSTGAARSHICVLTGGASLLPVALTIACGIERPMLLGKHLSLALLVSL